MDRAEQELLILERISQILGEGLELTEVFQHAMRELRDRLLIERASLVLYDEATESLRIAASIGMTDDEVQKGRYSRGEGITGQVMATGEPKIIPDIRSEPDFLDKTGIRASSQSQAISFISVPIRDGEGYVGVINAHKPYTDEMTLVADARLLTIIAGSFAQTIRIHNQVQLEKKRLLEENQQLRENLLDKFSFDNIIGSSPAMLDVLSTIGQVAASRATVLLLGETGAGKEMMAKSVHYNSPRRNKPFIRVNCGALSEQLLESELFGHVKGAFTGAVRDKIGRFEASHEGTIFLDEIGTLDMQLQVKLLRALQEREFERVGDHRTVKVDVRVIAATNLDLEEEVREGRFREDLYYRLNVVTVNIPPLRARREDIPRLIDFFLDRYNKENNRNLRKISRDVLNTLLRYPWPGNVRELENAIERAVVLSQADEFTEDLLPLQIRMFAQQVRSTATNESMEALAQKLADHCIEEHDNDEGQIYELAVGELEKQLIRVALKRNGGVKTRTADYLGINRNTLNKKVKDYEILAKEEVE